MELTIRPLTESEITAGPHWRPRCATLHPLALAHVAARLRWPEERVERVQLGQDYVVSASESREFTPGQWLGPEGGFELRDGVELKTGSGALEVALAACEGAVQQAPMWPFLRLLPIAPASLRKRWHGLNYLYARVSDRMSFLERVALEEVPASALEGFERVVEALFANGRRDRVFSTRTLAGEAPTLSRSEGFARDEPACTSLADVLREFAPGFDAASAFVATAPVRCSLQRAEHADVVVATLHAVGLRAESGAVIAP